MNVKGIGIDAVEIVRFRNLLKERNERFLKNTFSARESLYCRAFSDPAVRFAGMFAAKEAIQKAVGTSTVPLSSIEIRYRTSGKPSVWIADQPDRSILVSISHSSRIACAVALACLA